MRRRWLALVWLAIAAAVWNGFFDLLISRGTKEYLLQSAMARLGDGPVPSMGDIMAQTSHDAAITASIWAGVVLTAGWATLWLGRHRS